MKTAIQIAEDVRRGRCSATEVLENALCTIDRHNNSLNAFVHIDTERARSAAAEIDRKVRSGETLGPFAGVPFGIKDNESCAGMPSRYGSTVYKNALPEANDSVHVARLRAAGAVPVGKVAMAELGLDGVTHTILHGTTRNPWNPERSPGGSSGGSAAAVAAGLVPICTSGDALGSTRCPAAFSGLLGLKPSLGRIPRPHGFRDTASPGAHTTTVGDMARYLDLVSGPAHCDRMSLPAAAVNYEQAIETLDVTGLHVVWSPDLGFAPTLAEIENICEAAFETLVKSGGLNVKTRRYTCSNVYAEWNALAALDLVGEFEQAGILPDKLNQISPGPRAFIEGAKGLTECGRSEYRSHIRKLEAETADLFSEVDVLITPTTCMTAHPAAGPLPRQIGGRDATTTHGEPFTAIGSVCWNPSISVPAGVAKDGLPVGLLITGPRHRDEIVLRLARILEQTAPWPRTAPGWD